MMFILHIRYGGNVVKPRTRRKKLSYEVIDGILEMIQGGKVRAGERIPTDDELSDLFQVSRTSIREGTRSLVATGILEKRPGIGTFVCDPLPGPLRQVYVSGQADTRKALLDIMEFRKIVEPEIAALAAKRATEDKLQELYRCVIELERKVSESTRPPEDMEFHLTVARATCNSALIDACAMVIRYYEAATPFYLPDMVDVEDHRAIYLAIRDRDPEAARRRMLEHLSRREAS
jgi:GntR family transcriptional repressor for pyruvate dehydrogenase complex